MELIKLLDNNEIKDLRADIPLDKSVFVFINLIFRGGSFKNSQKAYHEDVLRLLKSTELYKFIAAKFPVVYISEKTLISDNYWVETYSSLRSNPQVTKDMMFFYGGVFSSKNQRKTFDYLRFVWEEHRNIIYQISALLIIHILGSKLIKDNLC